MMSLSYQILRIIVPLIVQIDARLWCHYNTSTATLRRWFLSMMEGVLGAMELKRVMRIHRFFDSLIHQASSRIVVH